MSVQVTNAHTRVSIDDYGTSQLLVISAIWMLIRPEGSDGTISSNSKFCRNTQAPLMFYTGTLCRNTRAPFVSYLGTLSQPLTLLNLILLKNEKILIPPTIWGTHGHHWLSIRKLIAEKDLLMNYTGNLSNFLLICRNIYAQKPLYYWV
jgi:hypothetical protein